MRSPLRFLRVNRYASLLAASRERERRAILEAVHRRGARTLVAVSPALARRIGARGLGIGDALASITTIIDPSLPEFAYRVH